MRHIKVFELYNQDDPSVCVLKRSDQYTFYTTHHKDSISNSDKILFDRISHSLINLLNGSTKIIKGAGGKPHYFKYQMSIIESSDLDAVTEADRGTKVITFGTRFKVSDVFFDSYYIDFHKFEDDWFVVTLHIPDFYSIIGGNDGTECVSYVCDSRDGLRDLPDFIKKERNIKGSVKKLNESDITLPKRSKQLSEDEFLKILREKCKNFSFSNDLLWRSKHKKYDLELFEPNYRNTSQVLAFPKFFDEIENHPDYPVMRKKSLIGGTNPDTCKRLGENNNNVYLVIPFDGSEIVFCPIFDLWALDDDRKGKSELVGGKKVSQDNFIKLNYEENFMVPIDALSYLPNSNKATKFGVEFFTSSPCLLVHESKINWLRNNIDSPTNEAYFSDEDTWESVDELNLVGFRQEHPSVDLTKKDREDIFSIFTNLSEKAHHSHTSKYSVMGQLDVKTSNLYVSINFWGPTIKCDIGIYKHTDEWFTIRLDIPPPKKAVHWRTEYYICDGLKGLSDYYKSNLK